MLWRDVVTLISTMPVPDGEGGHTDAETAREVFANVKSVKRAEWVAAQSSGQQAIFAAEVKVLDYADEEIIEYNGKRFYLIRGYSANGEDIELTCGGKKPDK